jgi:hypothetical protein
VVLLHRPLTVSAALKRWLKTPRRKARFYVV